MLDYAVAEVSDLYYEQLSKLFKNYGFVPSSYSMDEKSLPITQWSMNH
jgi:hypothetical protein